MKMTKKVNINAPIAVRTVTPPIYGTVKGIFMTTGDILKCLCKRARIEEILPNGNLVNLTMKNYFTDNGAGLDAEATYAALEKKSANPVNNGLSFAAAVNNVVDDANNAESDAELDATTEAEPDAAEQENLEVEPDAAEQEVLTDDTVETDAEYVEAQPVEEVVANDVVDDAVEVAAEPEVVETEPDAAEQENLTDDITEVTAEPDSVSVFSTSTVPVSAVGATTSSIQVSFDAESTTKNVEAETPVVETATVEKKKTSSRKRSTSSKK